MAPPVRAMVWGKNCGLKNAVQKFRPSRSVAHTPGLSMNAVMPVINTRLIHAAAAYSQPMMTCVFSANRPQ